MEEHHKKIIHDYYHKPEPGFFGDGKLYMGIELEIDDAGEDEEHAGEIYRTANIAAGHLYLKHDGSLCNGFELVSHPMTIEYHKNKMPWRNVLNRAIHMGYRSHQTDTCGLHIHVSRLALGDKFEEQESVTARLVFFYEKFWSEMLRFSRRTEEQANRWSSRYGGVLSTCKNSLDTAKKAGLGRYTAVNLTNKATIEFRIFRGTLRYETFIATLEFTHCLCCLAMKLDDERFQSVSWRDFVSGINKTEYPELINYLRIRGLYRNENAEGTEDI
ncbi:MAG TPA: amidoligase family protein [Candidatus Ornithomonoglobus merdipullorum]|uniref:Amidoligase family protein n=1 Tax=Candidatus Ornithomonoglobus merdipullorum TaxID=2840895 RepID=A0A9D1MDU2_9FIRM|nr:amidoligase family protein [Candidatus Ornithomonoglobus merdipullorum]